jgi:hypothetical protein
MHWHSKKQMSSIRDKIKFILSDHEIEVNFYFSLDYLCLDFKNIYKLIRQRVDAQIMNTSFNNKDVKNT